MALNRYDQPGELDLSFKLYEPLAWQPNMKFWATILAQQKQQGQQDQQKWGIGHIPVPKHLDSDAEAVQQGIAKYDERRKKIADLYAAGDFANANRLKSELITDLTRDAQPGGWMYQVESHYNQVAEAEAQYLEDAKSNKTPPDVRERTKAQFPIVTNPSYWDEDGKFVSGELDIPIRPNYLNISTELADRFIKGNYFDPNKTFLYRFDKKTGMYVNKDTNEFVSQGRVLQSVIAEFKGDPHELGAALSRMAQNMVFEEETSLMPNYIVDEINGKPVDELTPVERARLLRSGQYREFEFTDADGNKKTEIIDYEALGKDFIEDYKKKEIEEYESLGAIDPNTGYSVNGEDAAKRQQFLADRGYDIPVDRDFGTRSKKAEDQWRNDLASISDLQSYKERMLKLDYANQVVRAKAFSRQDSSLMFLPKHFFADDDNKPTITYGEGTASNVEGAAPGGKPKDAEEANKLSEAELYIGPDGNVYAKTKKLNISEHFERNKQAMWDMKKRIMKKFGESKYRRGLKPLETPLSDAEAEKRLIDELGAYESGDWYDSSFLTKITNRVIPFFQSLVSSEGEVMIEPEIYESILRKGYYLENEGLPGGLSENASDEDKLQYVEDYYNNLANMAGDIEYYYTSSLLSEKSEIGSIAKNLEEYYLGSNENIKKNLVNRDITTLYYGGFSSITGLEKILRERFNDDTIVVSTNNTTILGAIESIDKVGEWGSILFQYTQPETGETFQFAARPNEIHRTSNNYFYNRLFATTQLNKWGNALILENKGFDQTGTLADLQTTQAITGRNAKGIPVAQEINSDINGYIKDTLFKQYKQNVLANNPTDAQRAALEKIESDIDEGKIGTNFLTQGDRNKNYYVQYEPYFVSGIDKEKKNYSNLTNQFVFYTVDEKGRKGAPQFSIQGPEDYKAGDETYKGSNLVTGNLGQVYFWGADDLMDQWDNRLNK